MWEECADWSVAVVMKAATATVWPTRFIEGTDRRKKRKKRRQLSVDN